MPPKSAKIQNKAKTVTTNKPKIPQFKSTKNQHVKENPFVNDFVYSLDKDVVTTNPRAKKAGKFQTREQRLAAAAAAKEKNAKKAKAE
jgi:hypothetical protein